jgi:hypothetical protein
MNHLTNAEIAAFEPEDLPHTTLHLPVHFLSKFLLCFSLFPNSPFSRHHRQWSVIEAKLEVCSGTNDAEGSRLQGQAGLSTKVMERF